MIIQGDVRRLRRASSLQASTPSSKESAMTEHLRQARVTAYREGVQAVESALAGATDRELDARPAPGKWTARQIVHHLADSEMTAAVRLRRLIAEDQPNVGAYDESVYADRLHYNRPIESSLQAFRFARESTADL